MIKRSRKLAIGFGLLLAVGSTVPALAQPASSGAQPYAAACSASSVAADQSDRAHKLYEAGKAYYDDNNNDAAIAQFREAYKKDCAKHELLIIISRAYQLKGDLAEAIRALETYLERAPASLDAASLKTRIDNMRKQLLAQPPPPPTATATAAPTSTTAPPPAEVREHTVYPWLVVGLGGVAVLTGVILHVTRPSLPDSCDPDKAGQNGAVGTCTRGATQTEASFKDDQDTAGRWKNQPAIGTGFLVAGAVVVAGGLVWHFLEPTGPVDKVNARPKVSPQVAPSYAGLSLGGTF